MAGLSVPSLPVLLAALLLAPAGATTAEAELRKNPIRKVVTMLQDMQKSVEEEGEKEKDLFEKFMCYCSNGEGALESSIAQSKSSIEALTSEVSRGSAEKSQLEQEITQHKADREEAETAIKEATSMREKEAAEFAEASGELKSNIQGLGSALEALKKGVSAALLQTGVGNMLRSIIRNSPLVRDSEREMLLSFLESGDSSEAEGGSDQIIGIVDQMKETMEADLKESEDKEAEAKATFESLGSSKGSEISAAGKAIEAKTARVGEVAVAVVQGKADLKNTEDSLAEDIDMKANLAKNCAIKQKEYDERCKTRSQEIEAISDTIKMLNSDDALELFKKALPSSAAASFLQTSSRVRRTARSMIQRTLSADHRHSVHRRLMLASLRSKVGGFEKVVGMVDGMVGILQSEQVADDEQDKWCLAELDTAESEAKATKGDVADIEAMIEEQTDSLGTVKEEIEALKTGLVELDKSVAEATEQRKKEHAESIETTTANMAAIDLLGMAKNRLNKFYNPSMYKEPPKKEEEFVQVSVHGNPMPSPGFSAYQKAEGGNSIIQMLDEMIKDTEMDVAEAKRDEEEAQKDYEEAMSDAAKKREDDSKLIVSKEGEKAEKASELEDSKENKRTKSQALTVLEDKIENLHKTCDTLVEHYTAIREERTKEEEGLKTSKMVLAGAKVGFLQQ